MRVSIQKDGADTESGCKVCCNDAHKKKQLPTSSSFMMRTQSLRMLVGAPSSFVKAFRVLYLKGGPAT